MVTVPIHGINEKLDGSIASDQKRSYVRTSEDITSLADHVAAALTHTFSGLVFTSFVGIITVHPGEPPFVALRDEPFSRVEQEAIERYRS